MLDRDGYRPNVGIVLCNAKNEVFWGKRVNQHAWQFPQGGIKRGETPEQAMFRELHEEVGLKPEHVQILGRTRHWLRYDVPAQWLNPRKKTGNYRGQKQIWFLLRLIGKDSDVSLRASEHPEFDAWRWNDYWVPLEHVVEFKRSVYESALVELVTYFSMRHRPRLLFSWGFEQCQQFELQTLDRSIDRPKMDRQLRQELSGQIVIKAAE